MHPGAHGYVRATVSHRLTQIYPWNPDGDARPTGETVQGDYHYEVSDSEPELILRCWSPGTTYDHVVTFRVNMLEPEVASPLQLIRDFVGILKRVMRL